MLCGAATSSLGSRLTTRAARRTPIRTMATAAAAPAPVLAAGSERPKLGSTAAPTFITTWSCPYAQRSWIALNEKGVPYKAVHVDLKNKPEWFFPLNPYGRVPTVAWADAGKEHSIYESLVVNEYVADAFEGPSLLPESAVDRARMRLLIDQFGAKYGPAFGKVMFSGPDPSAAAALDDALKWLDSTLDPSGPYALGAHFTLADCAMAPFALRLPLLEPLCGYKVPAGLKRYEAWAKAVAERPSVKASMTPPDATRPYLDQMLDTYKAYVEDRKKAMAAATK